MALFSITDAQLAFGHVALLDHTDFSLEAGERVGLIGRNGTGKSSLLKIISGRSKLDDGLLVMQQGLKIAYVEQEPVFDPAMTVFDAVAGGMGEQQAMLAEYEALTGQFGQGNDEALMERYLAGEELAPADVAAALKSAVTNDELYQIGRAHV